MATRRALLRQVAAALGSLAAGRALGQPADEAAYVGIETDGATRHSSARFLSAGGAEIGRVALTYRAHGMARHGHRLAVFPRRPGDRFTLVDAVTLEVGAVVTAPAGRHFYGHGAFDADGTTLLVPENDMSDLSGWLARYEIRRLSARRLDAHPLPRPGPHEIIRQGDAFHIALGGLETHPDYGRTPLNLDAFASEVVTLDARGDLTAMGAWADGVSLRHLARDAAGRLYVGGQVPGAGSRGGTVLWVVVGGRVSPVETGDRLGGYVSSVAAHGGRAVATSKETGLALDLDGTAVLGETALDGASGAGLGSGLRAVSGYRLLVLDDARVPVSAGHEFDNHGLVLA